jgi:protein TonB
MRQGARPEVFTTHELAAAAGVAPSIVDAMAARGELRFVAGTRFVAWAEALRAGQELRVKAPIPNRNGPIQSKSQRVGIWDLGFGHWGLSLAAHAAVLLAAIWLATARTETAAAPIEEANPTRLVFVVSPGPGGGGGGGGVRVRAPRPPRAEPPESPLAPPPPVETPPPPPEPAVVAPIATTADAPDVLEAANPATGPGAGEGSGSGLGEGTGGGTGGGPYRPGSGIEPPRLLREVKADYTDEARRGNVRGDVVLEIVVRRDGTVGDVTVLQGLGAGLDQRAVAAVRQWRFSPARRLGAPVDVIVEVAVEFSLR